MAGISHSFDWARHAAHLIDSIGSEDIVVSALATLSDLVAFEHTGVFLFRGRRQPRDLLARRTGGIFHRTYCGHTYELDPFYKAAQHVRIGGVYRMPELDPLYRRYLAHYEMGPRLADVLPRRAAISSGCSGRLSEEIGFLFPVGAGRVVHIALIRSTALPSFSDDDVSRLREIAPVLQAAFESHFRWLPGTIEVDAGEDGPLDARRCPSWIAERLTAREVEVVEHMLVGLATEQVAARLAVAKTTVKVHRKNIYRKLAVCSRDELLARCAGAGRSNLAPDRPWRRG
ncbi:MAG: hypothetical protein FJX52_08875 [Alphaproteobacteria bacterium]|nr:hypothetical protein [Alphaproteobacteria bacterium]